MSKARLINDIMASSGVSWLAYWRNYSGAEICWRSVWRSSLKRKSSHLRGPKSKRLLTDDSTACTDSLRRAAPDGKKSQGRNGNDTSLLAFTAILTRGK